MIIIEDQTLRKILCDHYACSDQNGKQYPECEEWNEQKRECCNVHAWTLYALIKSKCLDTGKIRIVHRSEDVD